jgi:gamma-glutamyltranspeptidase/glutathione hydrolase
MATQRMKRHTRFKVKQLRLKKNVTTHINRCNRGAGIVIILSLIAGCGGFELPDPIAAINRATGTKQRVDERVVFGVVTADDPAAVTVGNGILLQGGSAIDAAVAMGFSMSVTFPARVGLGGGGVCLAGGGNAGKIQVLDFIPKAATSMGRYTDRPSAIPTLVRGMAALHARQSRLSWQAVIAPAKSLAHKGFIVTKAFEDDLAKFSVPLFADPVTRTIFSDKKGKAFTAGQRLRQIELNTVLATISGRGGGEFYNGIMAQRLLAAVKAAGGSLGREELRNFLPKWQDTVSVQIGDNIFYAPPPPASSGIVAIQMLQLGLAGSQRAAGGRAGQGHLIAEAAKRSLGERLKWLGSDYGASAQVQQFLSPAHALDLMSSFSSKKASPAEKFVDASRKIAQLDASASFLVVDGDGLVVACTLTMYHPFGTGRTTPGLGIVLAAAPGEKGRNPLSLGPVVVMRAKDNAFRFAFSSSGGATATTAMANVMFEALLAKRSLQAAISEPRLHFETASDQVVIEDSENKNRLVSLISLGHKVRRLPSTGRVNAISCPDGLPSPNPHCDVQADPRGSGVTSTVKFPKQER